jgi:hypothetical protein
MVADFMDHRPSPEEAPYSTPPNWRLEYKKSTE